MFECSKEYKRERLSIAISEIVPLTPLDGCGPLLKQSFVDFVRRNASPYDRVYGKAFEWCSGPGWIGLELLAQGVCESLCLADINPLAIESVKNTVVENGLEDRVTYYISDNFKSVPKDEKFDLVVSNPPNYFYVNPKNKFGKMMQGDLRPNDPDWIIHKGFYEQLEPHLNPGALVLISEVEPFKDVIHIPKDDPVPYEIREQAPHQEFVEMMEGAGLRYIETKKYYTLDEQVEMWMMVAKYGN